MVQRGTNGPQALIVDWKIPSQAPLSSAVRSSLEVSHQKIRTGDYTKRCSTTVLCCLGEAAKQNVSGSGGSTLRGSKLIVSPLPLH
jgi:hypothetical protein